MQERGSCLGVSVREARVGEGLSMVFQEVKWLVLHIIQIRAVHARPSSRPGVAIRV